MLLVEEVFRKLAPEKFAYTHLHHLLTVPEEDEYAGYQRAVQRKVIGPAGRAIPVGIIPKGHRRKEPLREEMRKRQKVLRPIKRPAATRLRGERFLTANLKILSEELNELRHLRERAGRRFTTDESPVTKAMEAQTRWLARYNEGIIARASMLARYRRDLAKKKEKKKPDWQIKKVEKKIAKAEDYATPYNRAHQEFIETRKDFGTCVCPPRDMTLDAWIREHAGELGLTTEIAPERRVHRGARTLAERRHIEEERRRAHVPFTQVSPESHLGRQIKLDAVKMELRKLEREKENLERSLRLG
jgi:hypothetical protein